MGLFHALFSVETPPTFGWGAFVMLRKGTAQTRALLHILTRGDILAIVRTDVPMTSALCEETILKLVDTYPFLRTEVLTTTAFGRPVRTLTIGEGDRKVIYSDAHHANEWITTPLILKFIEELAEAVQTVRVWLSR